MGRCIECDADLPGFDKLCKECWEERYAESAHPQRHNQWRQTIALLRQAPVTTALVLLNLAVFVAMVLSGVSFFEPRATDLLPWGAAYAPLALNGQWWRAVTEMFIHVGWAHLAFNMLCLLDLGILAERGFGSLTFACSYFLTGITASALSLIFHPADVCAGASGAIFGIAGLLIPAIFFGTIKLSIKKVREPLKGLVRFVCYNLLFGLLIPLVDNSAHLGGLLSGLALGTVLSLTRKIVVVQLPPPSEVGDAKQNSASAAPLRRFTSSGK